jgi:hypothetical protein
LVIYVARNVNKYIKYFKQYIFHLNLTVSIQPVAKKKLLLFELYSKC